MLWRILVAAALTLAILYFWQRMRAAKASADRDRASLARPKTLPNVRVGGVLSVRGLPDGEKNLVVAKRHGYSQGSSRWGELVAEDGTDQVFLEFEEDDRLEVSLTRQSKERLSDLQLDEDALIRFDEDEDGTFEHDGKRWRYVESAEAFFHEDGRPGPGDGFYYWDFEEVGGPGLISVERYEGEPFTVFRGQKIRPEDVSVWSVDSADTA
ncbi:MAG: DUF4178 domain-containing protein [Planctomycetota bacterium]